jgi:hypothetical protein
MTASLHGRLHNTKVQTRSSPRKAGSSRRPARGWVTAFFARPPEDLPSYPPLADLLSFAVLALARVPSEAAKKGPVTSGKLAGTMRLQPPHLACAYRRNAATASGPHRATRALDALKRGPERDDRKRVRGSGDKFFRGFAEGVETKRKSGPGEKAISPFPRELVPAGEMICTRTEWASIRPRI